MHIAPVFVNALSGSCTCPVGVSLPPHVTWFNASLGMPVSHFSQIYNSSRYCSVEAGLLTQSEQYGGTQRNKNGLDKCIILHLSISFNVVGDGEQQQNTRKQLETKKATLMIEYHEIWIREMCGTADIFRHSQYDEAAENPNAIALTVNAHGELCLTSGGALCLICFGPLYPMM
jgi:hypothetical protein